MRFFMYIASVLLISACSASAANQARRANAQRLVENPKISVEIDGIFYPQSDLALVEITAPDFGAWITEINEKPIISRGEITPDTVFLKPGKYEFSVTFSNIRISSTRSSIGKINAELEAGHTYMPHNNGFNSKTLSSASKASFGIFDYGMNFPRNCLTGQIAKIQKAYAVSFAVRKSLYKKCVKENNYDDTFYYNPSEAYN